MISNGSKQSPVPIGASFQKVRDSRKISGQTSFQVGQGLDLMIFWKGSVLSNNKNVVVAWEMDETLFMDSKSLYP
jgi:hypothetical protein